MFGRGVVVGALSDEVSALAGVLLGLSEEEAVLPTRCVPWDVASLAVHTVGALHQVDVSLDGVLPEPGRSFVSPVGYYTPDVRFSAEVNAEWVEGAVAAAGRRADAGEPGRVLRAAWRDLEPRVAREPVDRALVTRHGDPMLLTDFLVTRVVELVLHGVDLADALGREPWTSGRGLALVDEVLFGAADREALARVLPGAGGSGGLGAVRVVTGRAAVRVERGALEGVGVRALALG
ncbi:maleylpyruvate isomerase N-terminal domain-containing protein [Nocardiopsis nanhaiensis]